MNIWIPIEVVSHCVKRHENSNGTLIGLQINNDILHWHDNSNATYLGFVGVTTKHEKFLFVPTQTKDPR